MKLWVAGRVMGAYTKYRSLAVEQDVAWDLTGVYDDKEKALAACSSPQHFIATVNLNETCMKLGENFRELEWPHAEEWAEIYGVKQSSNINREE